MFRIGLVILLAANPLARAAAGLSTGLRTAGTEASRPVPQERGLDALRLALAEQRFSDAIEIGGLLLSAGSDYRELAPLLAEAHRGRGDLAGALLVYSSWLDLDARSRDATRGVAEIHRLAGDLAGSAAAYERLLEIPPVEPRDLRAAAAVAVARGDHTRVIDLLDRYLEEAEADTETLNALAIAFFQTGQRERASEHFERALRMDRDFVPALYGMGILHVRDRSLEAGVDYLARAAALMPGNASVAHELGAALAELERFVEAERELRRAIEIDASRAQSHYRLALVLSARGRREDAAAAMERFRALSGRSESTDADAARRQALLNDVVDAATAGDDRRAEELLGRALDEYPRDPETHLAAARYWTSRQQHGRVIEATDAALAMLPEHPDGLHLRGLALLALRRFDEAREVLGRLALLRPTLAVAHAALGNVLFAQDRLPDALREYELASRLEPENPGHWLNLAAAHGKLGNLERETAALAEYRRLLAVEGR